MTNVPDNLREMWRDVYVLFDSHYRMENSKEAWSGFWAEAEKITKKYGEKSYLIEIISSVADIIGERITDERTLEWKPDEDYPHPKEIPNDD